MKARVANMGMFRFGTRPTCVAIAVPTGPVVFQKFSRGLLHLVGGTAARQSVDGFELFFKKGLRRAVPPGMAPAVSNSTSEFRAGIRDAPTSCGSGEGKAAECR